MTTLNRRQFIETVTAGALMAGLPICRRPSKPANVVIVFLDDSGWADYAPFGSPDYAMPNIEQLAKEGCSYRNFYVPQAICSASRASLLSGCYPGRTGVFGAHGHGGRGLEPHFPILPELFKNQGYKTGVFGKWHIGDQPDTRPMARGVDAYCGLMVSNDMWKHHPENPEYWGQWPLPYWENDQIVIEDMTPEDQRYLTQKYTGKAVQFIKENKDQPFFLYVPHAMPHVPLYCSPEFQGKSQAGLYGDVMMEIDWSVGQINQALKEAGVEDNTLFILTSDNGPWISYGNHAGQTPFREAKATSFNGGTRSACVIKYPGEIKANSTSEATFCSIDFLPTLCHLTGAPLPESEIDGVNVYGLIRGKSQARNPHAYYAFSTVDRLEAVMTGDGEWKLHLPHEYRTLKTPGKDGMPGQYDNEAQGKALYHLSEDPLEAHNVMDEFPEIANMLEGYAKKHVKRFYPNKTVH